jgi:hypothetical protein
MNTNELRICLLMLVILFILLVYQKKIYTKQKFISANISKCEGKRDGVSGCRDCCKKRVPSHYQECVTHCMLF